MTFLEDAIKRVRDFDESRPRSQQAEVGWSELGGCRAYLGYRLDGAWATDEPDTWAAQRGTAIHEYLQAIFAGAGMRIEVVTSYRDVPGHADLVVDGSSVIDIKTTRLVNAQLWQRDKTVLWEKRVQAQGYAASLVDDGKLPADATVRLLVVPVDGKYPDWWCHEEPFDRSIADWGIDRLAEVRRMRDAGEMLPKDKPFTYCESWCKFFTLCRGGDDPMARETITDPELVAAVAAYAEARDDEKAATKRKDGAATLIRGLRGTAGEFRVSLSRGGEPGTALDEDWIRADYAARGEEVPEVETPGSAPRLSVTRIKAKAAKS